MKKSPYYTKEQFRELIDKIFKESQKYNIKRFQYSVADDGGGYGGSWEDDRKVKNVGDLK